MNFNITCRGKIETPIIPLSIVIERYFHALQNEGCKEVLIEDENEIFFKGTPIGSGIQGFRNSGLLEISSGHIVVRGVKGTLTTCYKLKCGFNSMHFLFLFMGVIAGVFVIPVSLAQQGFSDTFLIKILIALFFIIIFNFIMVDMPLEL